MGIRRYRSLRLWHNTLLMVWATPFLVLAGVIIGTLTGGFTLLRVLAALCVIGLGVAVARDRRVRCVYTLEGEHLVLTRNNVRREVLLDDIVDASPIERSGVREYVRAWYAGRERMLGDGTRSDSMEAPTRYCTVDVGFSTYTLGIGRGLIDRLPKARTDLVLLRLRSGEILVLSPVHAQDLVNDLGKRKLS